MKTDERLIFGKSYRFQFDEFFEDILTPSISLYPKIASDNYDVVISIMKTLDGDFLSRNPSVFFKGEKIFITKHIKGSAGWSFDEKENKLEISMTYNLQRNGLRAKVSRFRSMEYATEQEIFQQVFHEAILVPSMYFFKDRAVVHSAVLGVDGKAVMLAGTGGVGKTSASLALRKNNRISFIADDIAILSAQGVVFPNLAWPKIYGYNLSSYITRNELLKGRSIVDKLQFVYKTNKNPTRVRRKMRPDLLYNSYEKDAVPLNKIIYLFRDNSKKMFLTDLEKSTAIEMGIHVMRTEYSKLMHDNLEWNSYNSLGLNIEPNIRLEKIFNNWRISLSEAFNKVEIQLLHIPFNLPHEEYLKTVHKYIFL